MFGFHILKASQQKDPLGSYTLPGENLMFKDSNLVSQSIDIYNAMRGKQIHLEWDCHAV